MDPLTIGILAAVLLVAALYTQHISAKSKIREASTKADYLTQQNTLLTTELAQERSLLSQATSENSNLNRNLAELQSDLRNIQVRFNESITSQAQNQEKFEQLASKVLEHKASQFDRQHKEGIKEILEPLKERIKHFEEKIEKSSRANLEQHTSLKSQIFHLKELNEKITNEAANLTKALKGDNKTQGNWGELILESILDKSGLEKGREYFIQETLTNADGKILRPDVVVALPDGKKMIIDSKVSLKAYESLVSADNAELQQTASTAHYRSVKQHIDGLSAKNYHDLYQIESPDFVLMFIPIDTAFAAAVAIDNNIYAYAFERHIVIVTPSTLLATLKTVESIWKNEKQHRHAQEIASEAGKMYDKLALLTEDLLSIGRRIDQTKDAYQESMKKLVYGKGNLIGRAQKVKSLGAKANKTIASK